MAVHYERYENDIEVAEENLSSGSEDSRCPTRTRHSMNLKAQLFHDRWPCQISILQILTGLAILIIGLIQVIVLPLVYVNYSPGEVLLTIQFYRGNCYGVGIWGGILLMFTGSLGIRSSVNKDISIVYGYFIFVLIDTAAFTAMILLIIVGYGSAWTSREEYINAAEFDIHIVVSVSLVFGYILVILSFTQYYEVVFCGELQLCKRFVHCCLPCWCPKAVQLQELLEEGTGPQRLPSLPL